MISYARAIAGLFGAALCHIAAIGLCCAGTAKGIPSDSLKLNLKQAIELARSNFPSIKARMSAAKASTYQYAAAKTERLPDLNAMQQVTYASNNGLNGTYFGASGLAIPTSGSVKPSNTYQGTFGSFTTLLLNWNVFNFGLVKANINVYKSLVDQSQADLENEIFQQQIKAADAYLLLLIDQKLLEAEQKNFQRAGVFLRVVRAGASGGLRPGVDTSIFKAEYSKAEILVLQSQGEVLRQQNRLEYALGFVNSPVKIDTSYLNHVLPAIPENDSLNVHINPLLTIYESRINLSQARARLSGDSWLPQLSLLGGTWGRGSGIDRETGIYNSSFSKGVSFQTYNYLVGFTLSWNITSLFRRGKLYKAALEEVKSDQFLYKTQELGLKTDFRNAQISAEISVQQALEAPVQLNAAQNAYNQADARYASGLSSIPELAQAYYLLNRAEIDQLIAINNVWRSLLLESAASGELNIFLSQIKQ